LEGKDKSRCIEERKQMHIRRGFAGCGGEDDIRPGERWKGFPTVSPVHRGNDGLPFDVDDLAIPFAKWRNESLKAYGNAIVPQVMYRIFQYIDKTQIL
jgi:DNA (cytosine-5)-methyltransferase 1